MPVLQTKLSNEEVENIKKFAERKGMTTSQIIRESIISYMAKNTQPLSFGCMTNKIWLSDDFDTLPAGFEEYV